MRMNPWLPSALLLVATGCHDYATLQKSFCATARKLVYPGNGATPTDQPVGLCDSFDGTAVDNALWQVDTTPGATATVARAGASNGVLAESNRGAGALVLDAGPGARAQVVEARLTPTLSAGSGSGSHKVDDTYFGVRFFVNEGAGALAGKVQVLALEDATGKQRISFGYLDGRFVLDDGDDGRQLLSTGQPPAGEWICIDLRFGASSGLEVWSTGENPIYVLPAFPHDGGFAKLRLGAARAASEAFAGQETVWIDDVIIDDQTIGCSK